MAKRCSSSSRRSSAKKGVLLVLTLALLAATAVVHAAPIELPQHEKIFVPKLQHGKSFVRGKFIVQFDKKPAATAPAGRRSGRTSESLKKEAEGQQESFAVYCRRNRLPVKVTRSYTRVFNGAAVKIDSKEHLLKVADAPGVKRIWPVVQYDVPTRPGLFALDSQPAIPQFAHNLTGIFELQQQFPEMRGQDIKVGVVDSGIDWKHPAFALPNQKCETFKGPGCRVLYGYDFTGDDSVSGTFAPDADPMDCNGHGTHVAGIIGGNDSKIRGVAPGVVFGAYRVFGCDGRTSSDIIMQGLELAFQDGMDVINLSLGGAQVSVDHAENQAIDTLAENGVYVVAAASNEGRHGLSYVTAPSTAQHALSIASYDNLATLMNKATVTGVDELKEPVDFFYSEDIPKFPTKTPIKVIRSPNAPTSTTDGCAAFPAGHFKGGAALVRRGGCAFTDKAVNAIAAGADGVIIYNNQPEEVFGASIDKALVQKPVTTVSGRTGTAIWNAINAGKDVTIAFDNEGDFFKSATAGQPSDFSSWGLDTQLRLKPCFGAPGGNIYSAYPLAKGGYAQESGTSMATPYVAGIVALEVEKNGPSQGIESFKKLQQRFITTARPTVLNGLEQVESTLKVGGGLVDAVQFFRNKVSVTPYKIELGDTPQYPKSPVRTVELTIKNEGTETKQYRLEHTPSRAIMGDGGVKTEGFKTARLHPRVTFDKPSITLAAGQETKVKVTINANVPVIGKLPAPGHWLLSGYVTLQTADRKDQLNVPYAVMLGDYATMPVMPADGHEYYPVLIDGNVFDPANAGAAKTFKETDPVHTFTLDQTDLSTFPAVRFSTVLPTRYATVALLDASKPDTPIVGYIYREDFANRHVDRFQAPLPEAFEGFAYPTLDAKVPIPYPDGEYKFAIQYVKPKAFASPADPRAELLTGWTSPKFIIKRGGAPAPAPPAPAPNANGAAPAAASPSVEEPVAVFGRRRRPTHNAARGTSN